MKGVVNEFLERAGLFRNGNEPEYTAEMGENEHPYLHPGRKAKICYDGKDIGYIGEVHPMVCKNYDIKDRVVVAVIDMPRVLAFTETVSVRKFKGISNFPASTRDFSMVVPRELPVGKIEHVFKEKGGAYLEGFTLFDLYEGAQIGVGFKSVAYSLSFRAKDKSLSDEDVNAATERILKGLKELGIKLRE